MTDTIRTPAEALEAAAQACLLRKAFDGPPLDHPFDKGYLAACDACLKDIRALASSIPPAKSCHCRLSVGVPGRICDGAGCIPPAPDDAALAETVAKALADLDDCGDHRYYGPEARAVINALREAGALRHE